MDIYEYSSTPAGVIRAESSEGSKVTRVDLSKGVELYLEGHPYPFKGLPKPEAIFAINTIKKFILNSTPLWWIPPKRAITSFCAIALSLLKPYIIKPAYMMPVSKELRMMIGGDLGTVISHVVEYDSAYRARIQDLFSESSQTMIRHAPIKELWRLVTINRQRDYLALHKKMRKMAYFLTLLLLWPPTRKKILQAVDQCDYKNLMLDEADRYWLNQRTDYGKNNQNPIV